jgi:hypothetical protein
MTTNPSRRAVKPQVDPFASIRAAFARDLTGFSNAGSEAAENSREWTSFRPNREDFPVPELLLLLLRNVMGFQWSGHGEKVRWAIHFNFNDEPMRIELAKFGLRIAHRKDSVADINRLVGQLQSALRRVEKHVMPLIDQAIKGGDATIANRSHEFRRRYEFFRKHADSSFKKAERPVRSNSKSANSEEPQSITTLLEDFGQSMKLKHEGFYYSVAMIDAYFSYLEHRVTLLRAFTGKPLVEGQLETILGAKWDAKLRILIPQSDEGVFKPMLGRLRELKERIRNPFAHGGVENDRGSIFCHVPHIGAIPGNLSKTKHSARFQFIPVDTEDHASACKLFDEVDALLCAKSMAIPSALADGGVHPAWDKNSLRKYAALNKATGKDVEEYISHWNHVQDMHENMDY